MKRSLPLAALLLAFAPLRAGAVTLVHSNDVLGELEPCGCRSNPLGGMARKSQLLDKQANELGEYLQLDAGNLLFPTDDIPPVLREQSELQARYLLKSMDLLHHDAAVPGVKDFALGVPTFSKLVQGSRVRFLAANLKTKAGKALLPAHAVFSKVGKDGAKLRIGVFGWVGSNLTWPAGLRVDGAARLARAQVSALRKEKAQLIIALTHEGLEADQKLARDVPGIDVIVGGNSQSFLQDPMHEGHTLILQSSFRNQYVGLLPLAAPASETPAARGAAAAPFPQAGYRLVGLDPGYDAPATAPMAKLVAEFKAAIAELNTRTDPTLVTEMPARDGSTPKFQTFVRCAECHLKQFDFWRKTPHGNAYHALVKQHQEKNKECLSCHTVGLGDKEGFSEVPRLAGVADPEEPAKTRSWLGDAELDNYLVQLHEAKSLDDPLPGMTSLVPAPGVAGAGDAPAKLSVSQSLGKLSRVWTPVQCENCHQPGRNHPFSSGYTKTVEAKACLTCHTRERAPEWYHDGKLDASVVEAKRKLVTCPAGDLPPSP